MVVLLSGGGQGVLVGGGGTGRDRPYAVYTASGEVQPNDVTVELSCYARQALYAGIGLSSM